VIQRASRLTCQNHRPPCRKKGLFTKADFVYIAKDDEYKCPAGERAIYRFPTVDHKLNLRAYWTSACPRCPLKEQCSPSPYRRIRRWQHENVREAMQRRLDRRPDAMTIRRRTVEHVFGTLKHWMGIDPLLDSHTRTGEPRNEPSRTGVQPEGSRQNIRRR